MDKLFGWERFFENIPKILPYLSVTFQIVVYATGFGVLLAAFIVLAELKKIPVLNPFFKVYVSFMRGTPMLVQLMIIYYGIPALIDPVFGTNINRGFSAVTFAYITFILNQGAFLSAIFTVQSHPFPMGRQRRASVWDLRSFRPFGGSFCPRW
jgi:L-cystine transport system permease protein